jgi:hypothetical protein
MDLYDKLLIIAQRAGWRELRIAEGTFGTAVAGIQPDACDTYITEVPRYDQDLNAVHDIEMILTDGERKSYFEHLLDITLGSKEYNRITAPAWMRAEALVRTFKGGEA